MPVDSQPPLPLFQHPDPVTFFPAEILTKILRMVLAPADVMAPGACFTSDA